MQVFLKNTYHLHEDIQDFQQSLALFALASDSQQRVQLF